MTTVTDEQIKEALNVLKAVEEEEDLSTENRQAIINACARIVQTEEDIGGTPL
jgi:hypothetical protein